MCRVGLSRRLEAHTCALRLTQTLSSTMHARTHHACMCHIMHDMCHLMFHVISTQARQALYDSSCTDAVRTRITLLTVPHECVGYVCLVVVACVCVFIGMCVCPLLAQHTNTHHSLFQSHTTHEGAPIYFHPPSIPLALRVSFSCSVYVLRFLLCVVMLLSCFVPSVTWSCSQYCSIHVSLCTWDGAVVGRACDVCS